MKKRSQKLKKRIAHRWEKLKDEVTRDRANIRDELKNFSKDIQKLDSDGILVIVSEISQELRQNKELGSNQQDLMHAKVAMSAHVAAQIKFNENDLDHLGTINMLKYDFIDKIGSSDFKKFAIEQIEAIDLITKPQPNL